MGVYALSCIWYPLHLHTSAYYAAPSTYQTLYTLEKNKPAKKTRITNKPPLFLFPLHRFQHIYVSFLFSLLHVVWRIDSLKVVAEDRRLWVSEGLPILVHYALAFTLLPWQTYAASILLGGFLCAQVFMGGEAVLSIVVCLLLCVSCCVLCTFQWDASCIHIRHPQQLPHQYP